MIASLSKATVARRSLKPSLPSRELVLNVWMGMQTLSAEGIGKSYGGRQVVRDVSLNISRGEVVGLLGPNGAGKTTSFYMIVGLVMPETGRVLVDDTDIT